MQLIRPYLVNNLCISVNVCVVPGWCSGSPGRGSAGWTHTLFLEKMISPSSTVRDPPVPTLNVKRSEALEDARRRSRPNDISSSDRSLLPSSETETRQLLTFLSNQVYNSHLPNILMSSSHFGGCVIWRSHLSAPYYITEAVSLKKSNCDKIDLIDLIVTTYE